MDYLHAAGDIFKDVFVPPQMTDRRTHRRKQTRRAAGGGSAAPGPAGAFLALSRQFVSASACMHSLQLCGQSEAASDALPQPLLSSCSGQARRPHAMHLRHVQTTRRQREAATSAAPALQSKEDDETPAPAAVPCPRRTTGRAAPSCSGTHVARILLAAISTHALLCPCPLVSKPFCARTCSMMDSSPPQSCAPCICHL